MPQNIPSPALPISIPGLLEQGLNYHRGGQLSSAQAAYRRVLEAEPAHAQASYLLGMTHAQQGEFQTAIPCFLRALDAQPDYFDALYHLGSAYTEAGEWERAAQYLRAALPLQPEHAGAHYALGNALRAGDKTNAAIESYRQAVRCRPQHVAAHNNLGNALATEGDYQGAVAALRQAARLAPDEWQIHASLGAALHAYGNLEEAAVSCRRALALQPGSASLYANLAKVLWVQGKTDEARRVLDRAHVLIDAPHGVATNGEQANVDALLTLGGGYQALCEFASARSCFERASELAPRSAEARDRLGQICWTLGELEPAEACFHAALEIQPDSISALTRLSQVLSAFNRMEEAEALARQALRLCPTDAEAHRSLGQSLLKRGDYAQGWPRYDHIHRMDISAPRRFPQPRWNGSDLNGKTILIHAQFGLGDTIQFARYLPLVKARGGRVLFECQWELAVLLQNSPGFDEMVIRTPASGNRIPGVAFDVQFNLMSLPALFESNDASIPAAFPYVQADAERREHWRAYLQANLKSRRAENAGAITFLVGIVWAASTEGLRSCRAADFAPLSELPGVSLVSLQKGLEARQTADLPPDMRLHDLAPHICDFADTAAILSHLDLVITVDTSVAHLAGAMNVPVWTLLPFGADWRWQTDRADTPWYPSMRLFRQTHPGDWNSVFSQVIPALQRLSAGGVSA